MPKAKAKALAITGYIDVRYLITCHFCGYERNAGNAASIAEVARRLHDWGWREVSSEKYQVLAAACPGCAKTKDKDR